MLGQAENGCLEQAFRCFTTMGIALFSCLIWLENFDSSSMAKLFSLVTPDDFITKDVLLPF